MVIRACQSSSAHDSGLQFLVIEHAAEVGIRFGAAPARSDALFQARLVDMAHSGKIGVLLILEIEDVLGADQSIPDEADLYPVIRAEQPAIGKCAECSCAKGSAAWDSIGSRLPLCGWSPTKCKYTSHHYRRDHLDNLRADRQRGRRRRTGRVQHVQRPPRRSQRKSCTRLPSGDIACARTPAPPVSRSSARISGTSRCSDWQKSPLAERPAQFRPAHPLDAAARKRHRRETSARRTNPGVEIRLPIALPRERQHRVRARLRCRRRSAA